MDVAGRRTRIDESDGTVRQYGYDAVDRLVSETVSGALSYGKTFTYDAVGNRLTQDTTGSSASSLSYTYDNRDQLTLENATAYSYDLSGNLTSKTGDATYTWDFENRLKTVTLANGTVVSHEYDVDGNRVATTVTPSSGTPTVTKYLVDATQQLSQVIADLDAAGNLQAYYVRAGSELLAVLRPAGTTYTARYVHADGLGSVRAITDESGVVTDTRGYEAFGLMNQHAGVDELAYGFAGEAYEPKSKLAYHRARWMDARVGRFLGMDPAEGDDESPITRHPFIYAGANPLSYVDASGRQFDMASFSAAINAQVVLARLQLAAGFAAGGRAIGVAFQAFGNIGEMATLTVLRVAQAANPSFEFYRNQVIPSVATGGVRLIDFFVRCGQQSALLEIKYAIPRIGSAGFARMADQLNSSVASGKAQQVVLVLVRLPTSGELAKLYSNVGNVVVVTTEDLYPWLKTFFEIQF